MLCTKSPQIVSSFEITNPLHYLSVLMGQKLGTFQLGLLLTVVTVWNGMSAGSVASSET